MKDPPLTALGHDQAKELASYLASLPRGIDTDIEEGAPQMIFSSPY
jgi:broad specificity phosphatase PhoE